MLHAFFWVIPHCLNFICQCFRTLSVPPSYPPMKMEQAESSKMLAHKTQDARELPRRKHTTSFVCASRQTDGYTAQSASTVLTVVNELKRQAIKN